MRAGWSRAAASTSISPSSTTEFEERHVAHSTALHSVIKQRGAYLVGPMARYALNFDRLPGLGPGARAARPGLARSAATRSRASSCARWRWSMPARRRCASSRTTSSPTLPFVPVEPRAGVGFGCTEAPRGICWHRYEFDADGTVDQRAHRAADIAEPAQHRGRSRGRRRHAGRRVRRRDPAPLRADHPQLRSLHFVLGAFPQAHGDPRMSRSPRDRGHRARQSRPRR